MIGIDRSLAKGGLRLLYRISCCLLHFLYGLCLASRHSQYVCKATEDMEKLSKNEVEAM
jgi:hypothetical protein